MGKDRCCYNRECDDFDNTRMGHCAIFNIRSSLMCDKFRGEEPATSSRSTEALGYKALISKYDEYLAFLDDEDKVPIAIAHVHGWRCSEKAIEKGKKFRAEIDQMKKAL